MSETPAEILAEPHRRYNPLSDEWVLVSAGRTGRPWQGSHETSVSEDRPRYDPTCYLCPGNDRAGGATNPRYDGTFVFTNDFAALRPDSATGRLEDGLLVAEGEQGTCRVVCFSPRHDLTLAGMTAPEVVRVIDVWADQTAELGATYRWVQVFENRGEAMGASNPHPHGQIWAGTALPVEAVGRMRPSDAISLPPGVASCWTMSARKAAARGSSSKVTTGRSSFPSGRPGRTRR